MSGRSDTMSDEQRLAAVDLVIDMLARQTLPSQIKKRLGVHAEYGGRSHDIYDRITNDARTEFRARILAHTGTDLRGESIEFYRSVLRDDFATIDQRIEAQKSLDRLLSLQRPLEAKIDGEDVNDWVEREIERRINERQNKRNNT